MDAGMAREPGAGLQVDLPPHLSSGGEGGIWCFWAAVERVASLARGVRAAFAVWGDC